MWRGNPITLGNTRGCLYYRHAGFAPEGIRAFEFDHEIEALVEQPRERMCRIESDGRENRHQFPEEIFLHPGFLCRGPLIAPQEAYAFFGQLRQYDFVEHCVLVRDQIVRLMSDFPKYLGQRLAIGSRVSAGGYFRFEASDPDLKEFVQIAVYDAKKAQTLERRSMRIFGKRQHPAIEFQLAEFAV